MDLIIKSFVYRDNIAQAGFRFLLFLILVLVGVCGLLFFNFNSMSAEEIAYSKKIFWSFIYIGVIFCIFSVAFFCKVFIIKNTNLIIEGDKLYMPPFGFSKKGREIKVASIVDLKLESIGGSRRLTFGSTESSLRFQLDSLNFTNHDFETFFNLLNRELTKAHSNL